MTRTWPEDWESRKRGVNCPLCADLGGRSFHNGRVSSAVLERNAIAAGHVAVVFDRRHVASITDLTQEELRGLWADVQDVGRAVERVFNPCHVNSLSLGNIVPHLHVHIVPRYLDDSAPERPLPWLATPIPEEVFATRLLLLTDAMRS
jgi:diadenosine tetraphosphate (Ap4A) HIT family hydrolase